MKNCVIYARVSSRSQSYEQQIEKMRDYCKIKDYNIVAIYADKISGKSTDRDQYQAMIKALERNVAGIEVLVATKIDRIGRNLRDLLNFVEELKDLKVGLVCIDDNVDTTTPHGTLFMQIMGMVSEYERTLIRERTSEGYNRYRSNGGKVGQPKIELDMNEIHRQMALGVPKTTIARRFRVNAGTLYARLKEEAKLA